MGVLATGSRSTTQLLALAEICSDIADLTNEGNDAPPLLGSTSAHVVPAVRSAAPTAPTATERSQASRNSKQTTMESYSHPVLKEAHELAWAEFIYEASIPFNVVNLPSFQRLQALLQKVLATMFLISSPIADFSPLQNMKIPFSAPSAFILRTRALDAVYDNLKAAIDPLLNKSLLVYGGSLLLDGASNINGVY